MSLIVCCMILSAVKMYNVQLKSNSHRSLTMTITTMSMTTRTTLLKEQLCFGNASHLAGDTDFIDTCDHTLRVWHGTRRRGGPRASWAIELHKMSTRIAGNSENFARLVTPSAKPEWKCAVNTYCIFLTWAKWAPNGYQFSFCSLFTSMPHVPSGACRTTKHY